MRFLLSFDFFARLPTCFASLGGRLTLWRTAFSTFLKPPVSPKSESATGTSKWQSTAIAGLAERSLGSPFKIQGKSQRVLEPFHYCYGKLANPAFKAHGWQRS